MLDVAQVADFLNRIAPVARAASWDNVGLLLGSSSAPVQKIMTCLTVSPSTAREAMDEGASLIVSHHPIFFRPVKRLTNLTPEGRMLLELVQAGVAVYSPHTAFDNCAGGINDLLARRLGLDHVVPLCREDGPKQYKLVVFVPDQDLAKVADAMFAAGAGHIGQYSQCSFRLAGTGTFFGGAASNPTVGEKGRREEVAEWRLEAVCPEGALAEVISAMRRAHTYEEPAYDIYSLHPAPGRDGVGRVGALPQPTSLQALAELTRVRLSGASVQVVGEPAKLIERVAIVCGAGGEFIGAAATANADALLTGEARFHEGLAAQAAGVALILPGHYASERCGIEDLALILQGQFPDVSVWAARREADPFAHGAG